MAHAVVLPWSTGRQLVARQLRVSEAVVGVPQERVVHSEQVAAQLVAQLVVQLVVQQEALVPLQMHVPGLLVMR